MKKTTKIRLLKAISIGQLPVSALNTEMGVYLKTDRPGIYKDNKGHEITFDEATKLIKSDCFNVCCMFTNDEHYPESISISEASGGEGKHIEWREGKYVEITMETPDFQTKLQ